MVTDKKATPPQASDKPKQSTSEKVADSSVKTIDQKAPRKESVKNSSKSSVQPPVKGFPWIKTLLAIILIAVLGFTGWMGWTEWQSQLQGRAKMSDGLEANLTALQSKIDQQQQLGQQQMQKQSQTIAQLEDQLYSFKLRLNSQAERLLQLGSASRGDWLLSEAAYLIRLANQRLQVERSLDNPLAILENVDNIFVQLDDLELLPVRRALAEDIAALRMTRKIDREGIFLELQATLEAIRGLSVLEPVSASNASVLADNQTVSNQPLSVLDSFQRFSEKLGQLIVVQKRQQPIEPLLTSNEQSIIQHNIYLLLEQAQSALLREEQIIYTASLEKTSALLERYFQLNTASQALLERLKVLSERSVIQGLPDISGSLAAVQTMLNLRQSRLTEGEQQK